ncbi:MAG: STAS/SEC14 domain-containing protein [Ramlibacter sp.]|nr:STAS/SEC14 domain-containing protein [Ramlibacter sp.]
MDITMNAEPFRYSIERLGTHIEVRVTGNATLDEFVALIDAMAFETRKHRDRRALVNLLQVVNELKFTDHFQIGEEAARKLQNLDRLASIVPPDRITRTSEKVAQHKGMELRVFTDHAEALGWLIAV